MLLLFALPVVSPQATFRLECFLTELAGILQTLYMSLYVFPDVTSVGAAVVTGQAVVRALFPLYQLLDLPLHLGHVGDHQGLLTVDAPLLNALHLLLLCQLNLQVETVLVSVLNILG